jgi:hypothetical protein
MGASTLLLSGAFVAMATATTGSSDPRNWTRLDAATVSGRYQACSDARRGLEVVGCVLGLGARPAAASDLGAPTTVVRKREVTHVFETMPDPAPSSNAKPAAKGKPAPAASKHVTAAGSKPGAAPASSPRPSPSASPHDDDGRDG